MQKTLAPIARLSLAVCLALAGLSRPASAGAQTPLSVSAQAVTEVAAGVDATCVVTDGRVQCWGANDVGQLALRTAADRPIIDQPELSMVSGVTGLAAGSAHFCAIGAGGGLICWGWNSSGQLGVGDANSRDLPVQVTNLSVPTAVVAAGDGYTCAVATDHTVRCWGYNGSGQLGVGDTAPRLTPTIVTGVSAQAIAIEEDHSCAVTLGGGVKCWGANDYGQLGNGSPSAVEPAPVDVTGLAGVTHVSVGLQHSCALTGAGDVYCWGNNGGYAVGQNPALFPTDAITTPTVVSGLSGPAIAIDAGYDTSCALINTGVLQCWGRNYYGQLGRGDFFGDYLPQPVTGISNLTHVSIGLEHVCATSSTNKVYCWGQNTLRQLGIASAPSRDTPNAVPGLTDVTAVAAGYAHICALAAVGLRCWGDNTSGQLKLPATTPFVPAASTPQAPDALPGDLVRIAAGNWGTCGLNVAGALTCWQAAYGPSGGPYTGVADVAVGGGHGCFATTGGAAYCWGLNFLGQIGDGSTTFRAAATAVSGLASGVAQVVAGQYFSCARLGTGAVQCWGDNSVGQLGDGTQTERPTPVAVSGISNAVQVVAGTDFACARLTGDTVSCWGSNTHRQLGTGTGSLSTTPVAVPGLTNVVGLAAGAYHACALQGSGAIVCWGMNDSGAAGQPASADSNVAPTAVTGISNAIAVTAGGMFTCALLGDSTLTCWGKDDSGQLGQGNVVVSPIPLVATLADNTWQLFVTSIVKP